MDEIERIIAYVFSAPSSPDQKQKSSNSLGRSRPSAAPNAPLKFTLTWKIYTTTTRSRHQKNFILDPS